MPSCQRKRIFQVVLPPIPQRDLACKRIDGLLNKITPWWPERVKLINYHAPRELMLNVMMHGKGGLIQANEIFQGGRKALEVVSLDNGPGIKDEYKEKLFLPNFSTKKDGTGLGLAIANRIVKEHGGNIRIRDNSPHGTIFTLEVPVKEG
jgi:signal transduction histidine kinase